MHWSFTKLPCRTPASSEECRSMIAMMHASTTRRGLDEAALVVVLVVVVVAIVGGSSAGWLMRRSRACVSIYSQ